MIVTSTIVGHVGQLVRAVGEDRRRHQLEHGVLGAGHVDRAVQLADAAHDDLPRSVVAPLHRAAITTRPVCSRRAGRRSQRRPPRRRRRRGRDGTPCRRASGPTEPGVGGRPASAPATTSCSSEPAGDGTFAQADGPVHELPADADPVDRRRRRPLAGDDDATAGRSRGSPGCSPCRCAGRSPAAARRRPHAAHDARRAPTPWWAPPDRLDPRSADRARPARRGVDVVGVHQHAVHPDRQLRRRRLRRQRHRRRRRRLGRAGRDHPRAAGRRPRRPHRPAPGRRRRWRSPRRWSPRPARSPRRSRSSSPPRRIGRPLGLALDFLVAVVAAEEMPRNSRAYAVSVLAMASGLGAGVAVMALPLADISAGSWRLVYLVAAGLAGRRRRHRPPAARDAALRAPARHRPAARPAPVRRARRRRPAGQPLRRPGQPVPERLPRGRPRASRPRRSPSSRSPRRRRPGSG